MRSTVVIEIHRPRRQVAMLFADPANMTKWMRELERYEHIGGETGAVGARYRWSSRQAGGKGPSSRR